MESSGHDPAETVITPEGIVPRAKAEARAGKLTQYA